MHTEVTLMKIAQYDITQTASHFYARAEVQKTQVTVQVIPPQNQAVVLDLKAPPVEQENMFHLSEEDEAKIRLLEKLIEALTGKKFKFSQIFRKTEQSESKNSETPSPSPNTPAPGFSVLLKHSHEISEKEQVSYQSTGTVKTADGQSIAFNLNFHLSREYYESSQFEMRFGQALKDPLVINLDAKGIGFSGKTLSIDVDLDGILDQMPLLNEGNGFLVVDKNKNGIIDDGSELFGPQTGHGFSELAEHDADKNGWIDENDAIFKELRVWTFSESGEEQLIGLKEAGVGAIYLSYAKTPYHFKTGDETYAKLKSTGTYLKENGMAMTLHEVDLKL